MTDDRYTPGPASRRYTPGPDEMVLWFGQLVFLVTDAGIRFGLYGRSIGQTRNARDGRARRMTKHGRRRRNRAA